MTSHRFKKDTLVIGALAGIIATLVQDLLGLLAIMIWSPFLNCIRIAGGLMLRPDQVLGGGLWPFILGFQIDLVVGIVFGVVTVIILQQWGNDFFILKGAMIGLAAWALFYNVLSRQLSRVYPAESVLQAEIAFLTHLAFGISLTYSVVWLSKSISKKN
ncbi:MAG: hypothetical protein ACOYVD_10145 [Bacillota bacterium]